MWIDLLYYAMYSQRILFLILNIKWSRNTPINVNILHVGTSSQVYRVDVEALKPYTSPSLTFWLSPTHSHVFSCLLLFLPPSVQRRGVIFLCSVRVGAVAQLHLKALLIVVAPISSSFLSSNDLSISHLAIHPSIHPVTKWAGSLCCRGDWQRCRRIAHVLLLFVFPH